MSDNNSNIDPCGEVGPVQRWAFVWFFVMVLCGGMLTYRLATIDRWMYDNNGERLDYDAYRENRSATTSIGSERIDPRQLSSEPVAQKRAAQ